MLDARGLSAAVIVIPHFEGLATASTIAYDGPTSGVIVAREDIDVIDGKALEDEAHRIASVVMGPSS